MDTLDDRLRRVASGASRSEPIKKVPRDTAAVGIVFGRQGFLLIKRVERPGDPWSGQVALPGGRVQARDGTFSDTASRETFEEVGLDLKVSADFIGYMGSFEPVNRRVSVVPCIFYLRSEGLVLPNSEVSSYRWVALEELSTTSRDEYVLYQGDRAASLPAFRFGDYLVWGLTERILTRLADLAGIKV